jgi:hypothetical protein
MNRKRWLLSDALGLKGLKITGVSSKLNCVLMDSGFTVYAQKVW